MIKLNLIERIIGKIMSRIFLVQFNFNAYLFSEENFYKFIERNSNKGWTFLYGEVDSNMPLKSPKDIKPNELKKEFNLNKIKPLLEYKIVRIGSQYVSDTPHFTKEVYLKYGERRR